MAQGRTRTPSPKSTGNRAVVQPKPEHHRTDMTGLILVAIGVVIGIGLAMKDSGVLGGFLSSVFLSLFGRGAWVAPISFIALGAAYFAGKAKFELSRLSIGLSLIFLSIVGFLSSRMTGDLFDPEKVLNFGGYVGSVVAWIFVTLLGPANPVGIGVLAMAGLLFCINAPLRSFLKREERLTVGNITLPRGRTEVLEGPIDDTVSSRKAALKAALMRQEAETQPTRTIKGAEPTISPQTKRMPIMTDVNDKIPNLFGGANSEDSTPKEGYSLPPLSLLADPPSRPKRTAAEMQRNIETLEGTLEEFGIEANVVEVATGPTITRYEIQLGPGVRVGRITALGDNIAMNLAASHVRVEAPIPGKAAVGVEVPNSSPTMVTLRELCEDKNFRDNPSRLIVGLGQDVSGQNRYADLTKMPHLLIGGATNSGKSIGLAAIITSLLMRNTPKDVRMVMIDPKRVELSLFDGIPHLMCPVVKDVRDAPGVLRAVWREMDVRYDRFSEVGVRNIDGWNAKASFSDKLPYIVVIIDELADLMIQAAAEVETSIVRLAQLARAVGIHLVIATQRPSVDVITGTIKANIPSRMAFSVSSHIDSRTILDQAGAEKLVGKGDMLFLPIDANKPTRVQGCYVSEKEIEQVCDHWKKQEKPHYVLNPIEVAINEREREMTEQTDGDALWEEVVRFIVERQQASTSMIQRRFSIGFQRASRLLDMMENRGIVGPKDGSRPREVLVDPMQVESIFGRAYQDVVDLDIDPLD